MHFSLTIIFAATLALTGCSDSSVVTIANRSGITLSNVVVSGSGFTNRLESLSPRAEQQFAVHPHGESGLRIMFDAAGQKIDSGEQGYFEGAGYRVSAVIATNLSVTISSDLER